MQAVTAALEQLPEGGRRWPPIPPSVQEELTRLREQLAKLELLRSVLGDELTDQKKAEVESQRWGFCRAGQDRLQPLGAGGAGRVPGARRGGL
jgi:hypothetical protein